jgi:hypothetical protein
MGASNEPGITIDVLKSPAAVGKRPRSAVGRGINEMLQNMLNGTLIQWLAILGFVLVCLLIVLAMMWPGGKR